MYAYSDMEYLHRHNFLSFEAIFCFVTPLLTSKIQIWKKDVKKSLEILSFYTCIPLIKIIWCMVPEVWSSADNFFVILGSPLRFYPPNNLKNENIKNDFTQVYQKSWYHVILFLRWCVRDVIVIFHFGLFFAF